MVAGGARLILMSNAFPGWKKSAGHTMVHATVGAVKFVQDADGVWSVEATLTIGRSTVRVDFTIEQARDADIIERVQ